MKAAIATALGDEVFHPAMTRRFGRVSAEECDRAALKIKSHYGDDGNLKVIRRSWVPLRWCCGRRMLIVRRYGVLEVSTCTQHALSGWKSTYLVCACSCCSRARVLWP